MANAAPLSIPEIAALLAARAVPGRPLIVGLTGSVAAGKTTLAALIVSELANARRVETVSTDGFLMPTAKLRELDLFTRKGFPETYDGAAMVTAIDAARERPVRFPGYSHVTFDPDDALGRDIDRPDMLLLEGLGFSPREDAHDPRAALDLLIYLDAEEVDLENWFTARFIDLWRAAEHDPASFYAQFRHMNETEIDAFARMVWTGINLPNLRQHIIRARATADIVLHKHADHTLELIKA